MKPKIEKESDMMLAKFKTYQMSLEVYESCQKIKVPSFLKLQLLRAASSVTLNIAEISGRKNTKERQQFFAIALGSLREVKAAIDLSKQGNLILENKIDHIAACLYKLSH